MVHRIRENIDRPRRRESIKGLTAHAVAFMLFGANRRSFRAVTVRASWRIIFPFVNSKVLEVDFVDYHKTGGEYP